MGLQLLRGLGGLDPNVEHMIQGNRSYFNPKIDSYLVAGNTYKGEL